MRRLVLTTLAAVLGRCKAYGADVPAHCICVGRKKNYFFATRA